MASDKNKGETYLPLLQDAQAYLKLLLEDRVPDSVLVVAWEEFYRVYDDLIRRYVVAQGVPQADVDDCVQDVWGEVAKRLFKFDRPADRPGLRAWLYALVRSKATNAFRSKVRRAADSLEQAKQAGIEPSVSPADFAELDEQRWQAALLEIVLEELRQEVSDVNYRVLHMRLVDGRSVTDVAKELDLTPEQVRYRHHRVMQKLRSRLAFFAGDSIGSDEE